MGVESMFLKFQIYRTLRCEIDYVRTNVRDLPYGGLNFFFEHVRCNSGKQGAHALKYTMLELVVSLSWWENILFPPSVTLEMELHRALSNGLICRYIGELR